MSNRSRSFVAALAVLFIAALPATALADLTFLHLNDTYRIGDVEDGTRGGFGRVTTVIRRLQAEGRTVRLLHGGDFLYPSLESQLWDGEQMIDAFNYMNALAPLIVVPGNHEFDRRGPQQVADAIRKSEFAWIAANVALESGDDEIDARLEDEVTFAAGDRRIGVFGLTLVPEDGGNLRGYLRYEDGYPETARASLDRLRARGADLIIGLPHLHMEDDLRLAALRRDYPEFRFIVGGHEHEPEHAAPDAGTAEVMKGASNARVIWQIDVDFESSGEIAVSTRTVELDESIAPDAGYEQLAQKWRGKLLQTIPFLESKIGEAAVRFDAREVTIRNEESNWGNFVVDQMRTAFGTPPAELAFLNSGTLRIDDYIAGDITFEDVARTFGFSSYLRYLRMTGGDFRETLEAGYRGEAPSKGYFPQISGFRVCIDRSRPEGQRIVQLQVPDGEGWTAIDADREYFVVAPEYLTCGGDGYDFSEHLEMSRPGSELRYLVFDAIVRAQAQGRAVGEPVDPDNPRIAFAESGGECFSR